MSSIASENRPGFFFVGNQPALDLANTLAATNAGPLELLPDFSALCLWLKEARLVSAPEMAVLTKAWSKKQQATFLQEVKSYRTGIKKVAEALERTQQVPAGFMAETNRLLRSASAVLQIKPGAKNTFTRTWPLDWRQPDSVLGLIAETGLQLVCDCDLSLIRKCENPQCVLFFYDTTKNHQRRWCSMEACGNRHKAALHRQKLRDSREG